MTVSRQTKQASCIKLHANDRLYWSTYYKTVVGLACRLPPYHERQRSCKEGSADLGKWLLPMLLGKFCSFCREGFSTA